jgi:hypothetical protein
MIKGERAEPRKQQEYDKSDNARHAPLRPGIAGDVVGGHDQPIAGGHRKTRQILGVPRFARKAYGRGANRLGGGFGDGQARRGSAKRLDPRSAQAGLGMLGGTRRCDIWAKRRGHRPTTVAAEKGAGPCHRLVSRVGRGSPHIRRNCARPACRDQGSHSKQLVGAGAERRGNGQAERLRGPDVDHQLKYVRRLPGKSWCFAP